MNLNYTILWFDDDVDSFESFDTESIERAIESWGFNPNIIKVSEPADFLTHNPWSNFDLIVVDFTLENYEGNGAEFIETIRNHQVLTEIIFYSSRDSSDLWAEIHSKKLEGVYIANRRLIESKVIRVAEHSVHKVLDLENMRGIVMAQVGELDHLLDEVFVTAMGKLPEEVRAKIFDKGHRSIKKQADDRHEALDAFISSPTVEELLKMCDSNKRWQNFCRIRDQNKEFEELVSNDYVEDILEKRNFLAHGIPAPHEDGGYIFTHGTKEYLFNEDASLMLRQKIRSYRLQFIKAIEVAHSLPAII